MDAPTSTSAPAAPRRKTRWLRGLAIAATTLLVLFGVLELVARSVLPKGIFSYRPIYAAHAVAGYRLKPNLQEYALGADVRTNARGFRGGAWSQAKGEGTLRIALAGDSLAFGFGVEEPETVGEVLAAALSRRLGRPCEVLNFGVPGYNALQVRELVEREVLGLDPDLVLVLLCSNDHEPPLFVDAEGYLHFDPELGELGLVEPEGLPRRSRWGILRYSALVTWAKIEWSKRKIREREARDPRPPAPTREHWAAEVPADWQQSIRAPLAEIGSLCTARGIRSAVLSACWDPRYGTLLRELSAAEHLPVLDLPSLFPETPGWVQYQRAYSLGWDSHPNAVAHGRWAQGIEAFLADEELLPGS